jgi:2-oxoglutarate dehydrogenase E2 component (dihydrolipoamide succinyltransferase)
VLTEIVADGGTVVSDQVIAKIDTEAAAGAVRRAGRCCRAGAAAAAVAAPAATGGSKPTWPCRPPPS